MYGGTGQGIDLSLLCVLCLLGPSVLRNYALLLKDWDRREKYDSHTLLS